MPAADDHHNAGDPMKRVSVRLTRTKAGTFTLTVRGRDGGVWRKHAGIDSEDEALRRARTWAGFFNTNVERRY